jgi:hypothetical protein
MNTITKVNSWHYQWSTPVASGDKLSSNYGVMTANWRQAWPEEPIIKSSHRPRRWKEPSSSSNPHSDIISEEHLKILLTILSIQNYFFNPHLWLGFRCLDISIPKPSTHFRRLSRVSAICFRIGRARFNPHLRWGFRVLLTREYRRHGAEVSQHRRTTIRGMFWGVAIRRGCLILIYIGDGHWRRINLDTLEAAAIPLARSEEVALE